MGGRHIAYACGRLLFVCGLREGFHVNHITWREVKEVRGLNESNMPPLLLCFVFEAFRAEVASITEDRSGFWGQIVFYV